MIRIMFQTSLSNWNPYRKSIFLDAESDDNFEHIGSKDIVQTRLFLFRNNHMDFNCQGLANQHFILCTGFII